MEINTEYWSRLGIFLCLLLLMLLWEGLTPRRKPIEIKWQRRINNILLVIFGSFLLWCIPVSALWASIAAEDRRWGLFNIYQLPDIPELVLTLLFLDLLIYGQHVVFHKIPALWRIHRVHHSDMDFDVTTGIRFHPVELILSMFIKIAGIICIGASLSAVIIFEIVLNGTSMFNHGNVNIPVKLDKILRLFIVTPDMHRVHHSVIRKETDSNYGFNLPWWDRIFGTYRAQPESGHLAMKIGLLDIIGDRAIKLGGLLVQPFIQVKNYQKNVNSY